ncbi:MAG: VCBS repeat-containing protein, partial [Verrucomicrobia bacterium]|nr:VCBS repeat-containing protein [Verrucomicrobiota bacterium]
LPEPSHLDRATWKDELLPKMAVMAGVIAPPPKGAFEDMEVLLAAKYFPDKPMIPKEAFEDIRAYYLEAAPETTGHSRPAETASMGLPQFEVFLPPRRRSPALTTFLKVMPADRAVMVGDATFQGVDLIGADGGAMRSIELKNIPTAMAQTGKGLYFACIGHFFPRDQRHGQVLFYERNQNRMTRRVLGPLRSRLSDIQVADLNSDGLEDVVVCEFGNMLGELSWLARKPSGEYEEHSLLKKPGALRAVVRDFNNDGKPDIGTLFGQALEAFYVWIGDGRGGFQQHTVWQKDPGWGHSGFEMADFDADGREDFLVTNGDNADFNNSPMRPHHAIRILLRREGLKADEVWSYPMNGAYRAVARDFDKDGDLDIAAISFFPDYTRPQDESFVYLENTAGKGKLGFKARAFSESTIGRWLTLEAGDVDGDGDEDLVLGSLTEMPTPVLDAIRKVWVDRGPTFVILKNRLKNP